jgi:ABC-type lipoprotein export system ATPase subunit
MSGAEISVNDVSRMFKLGDEEIWAVRDINLKIEKGEFVALIGRSGSGKTTLLNLIAGLDRPSEGSITIDGERVDLMNESALVNLRRRKLGFVFQSFGLLPLLSAYENVELPLRISGTKGRDRTKRTNELLDLVGLSSRSQHRPYELSGGEQQRIAIARALAAEPDLLLADEPTGELDSATATAVFSLLRDISRQQGITIVTCTHDRLVMEMADRIEELDDGKLGATSGEVWGRVQSRQRSPFTAREGIAETEGGLSSLIGGDLTKFVDRATTQLEKETHLPTANEPTENEPDERWSRPDRKNS